MPRSLSRRELLVAASATGTGLVLGTSGCSDQRVQGSFYVPTPAEPLTPNELFYINYCCGVPEDTSRDRWRLTVDGLVDRPFDLGFSALLEEFRSETREITLECIGNSPGGTLISSGAFTGVRLSDVMKRAGLSRRARGLYFVGGDGYPSFMPVSVAQDPDALLVYALGGEPLSQAHGAPVRVLFPGRYGMKQVKWLRSITATRQFHNYGSFRGLEFSFDGRTPVKSQFLRTPTQLRAGEPTVLTGLAVSSGVGISRVEVDLGEGWVPARLTFNTAEDPRNPFLWSLFEAEIVPPRAGERVVRARAFDTAGRTQTEERRFPYDSGAIHSFRTVVV